VAKALNMQAFQDKPVLVGGHTDARGTDEYNKQLSDARAIAVRDYLVNERGLDPARLQAEGFGEKSPLAGLSPLDDNQRRVEFRLLPTS
jgi:outer membrane protein OmpA-like peptidoglycan-associated protein